MKQIIQLSILIFLLGTACKKQPGEGGTSSIKGKVWVEDWNKAFTIKNGEYAGYDRDVYIIYGEDVSYSDKTKTNYNGEFEFKFLRKGKYKLYVYSQDNTLQAVSGDTCFIQTIEITANKKTVETSNFVIFE